jgi:hypothetical protein
MAMTLEEIQQLLQEGKLKFRVHDERSVVMMWDTRKYRNLEGALTLLVVVQLSEDGEYVKVFMPNAFTAKGAHVDVLLKACMMVQWRTKLVQFEYDSQGGEIRPIVEFPLEDSKLTSKQLRRCVTSLVFLVDEYYDTLKKALDEGVLHFPEAPVPPKGSAGIAAEMLLGALKADGLLDTDPRVSAVRQLIEDLRGAGKGQTGDGPPSEV